MAKRKKRTRKRRAAADPVAQGKEAFRRGDYDATIAAWEKAYQAQPSKELASAIAEVYFRRGQVQFYRQGDEAQGLSDLDEATRLDPDEPRYAYHLGLAHHRQDHLATALTSYRLALEADPGFARAAEMAALVYLEQDENPQETPAWKALPLDKQAELKPLVALIRGAPDVPVSVPPQPDTTDPGHLWQALIALRSGAGDARDLLATWVQADGQPEPVRAVAAYALGLDALRQGEDEMAQAHWEAARRLGLEAKVFEKNLGHLYRRRSIDVASGGRWPEAAAAADAAQDLLPFTRELEQWAITAHLQAGYTEAQAGRWSAARDHWQKAAYLGEDSRDLVQNLALAHEKTGQFYQAAELWREVVRRRPRKADAPDALTSKQVALLWGHVAECYAQAGDVEEAITTLRNAVRNDPENLDLRLELVDALSANDQWDAASNEIGRILDRDPDKVGALVRAARIDEMDGYLARARQIWEQVLELAPDHLEARERLAGVLTRQGTRLLQRGDFDRALEALREAVAYVPDEPYLYLGCADCELHQDDVEAARRDLKEAFAVAPDDLGLYHSAVDIVHEAGYPSEAEWVIAQAEEYYGEAHLPAEFYLGIAECSFGRDEPDYGTDYVKRAEKAAEGDPDGLVAVGVFYLDHDEMEPALHFFDEALRLDREHGWANYHVGASYGAAGEMQEANRYWRQARRTARVKGDDELLAAVQMTKEEFQHALDMIERGLPPLPGR